MSTLGINTHVGLEDGDSKNATTMDSMVGFAGVAFDVADKSLKPPQSIAILSAAAAGSVADEFNGFKRVDSMSLQKKPDGNLFEPHIHHTGKSYNLRTNKVFKDGNWKTDANILIYQKSNTEYILQVDGKLIHITDTSIDSKQYILAKNFTRYDSETDIDGFIEFAESMGINEHTVLGAKIILKTLMGNMDYDMRKLDETFMNPQADYLAFINQTLSPVIEAGLTATMSGLKSAIDFLKKIIQKASS